MKLRWLERGEREGLLLFFNGWGMDEQPVRHLTAPPGRDLLMAYDYRDLEGAGELMTCLERYRSVRLVAWSMGVWAAAKVFDGRRNVPAAAVAVNGTCRPIDEDRGIPPDIYRATVEGFSEAARESFLRRMCGKGEVQAFFRARAPRRDFPGQEEELKALEEQAGRSAPPPSFFSRAVIGRRDRIMPAGNQIRYWEGRAPYRVMDLPHYPFFQWREWEEAFADAPAD